MAAGIDEDWPLWAWFTNPARRAIHCAQEEAARRGGTCVGTSHLLFGLVQGGDAVAATVLGRLGIPAASVRAAIQEKLAPEGGGRGLRMRLTARASQALELAYAAARGLGDHYVGTEHLLLALLHEEEGRAQGERGREAAPGGPGGGEAGLGRGSLPADWDDQGGRVLASFGARLDLARTEVRKMMEG